MLKNNGDFLSYVLLDTELRTCFFAKEIDHDTGFVYPIDVESLLVDGDAFTSK